MAAKSASLDPALSQNASTTRRQRAEIKVLPENISTGTEGLMALIAEATPSPFISGIS
jgi:hypothetical protein